MTISTNHHQAHHSPPRTTDVTLTPETVELLEHRMAAAVQAGIQGAMTEEAAAAFWGAGLRALQKQASEHTGRFVIGGLWGMFRKVSMFLAIGGMVYAIGGWTALAKFWHTIWGAS